MFSCFSFVNLPRYCKYVVALGECQLILLNIFCVRWTMLHPAPSSNFINPHHHPNSPPPRRAWFSKRFGICLKDCFPYLCIIFKKLTLFLSYPIYLQLINARDSIQDIHENLRTQVLTILKDCQDKPLLNNLFTDGMTNGHQD